MFNYWIAEGNLAADPEPSTSKNGTPLARFKIASDPDGAYLGDQTIFIDCDLAGKEAERACRALRKGMAAIVRGRLTKRSWAGKDGAEKTRFILRCEGFDLPRKGRGLRSIEEEREEEALGKEKRETPGFEIQISDDALPF